MVLVTIAFFVIGNVLARSDGSKEFLSYSQLSENMQSYAVAVENVYDEIRHDYQENPEILENYDYLDKISEELRSRNTYLLIRKGSQLYYSGNEEDSELVFRVLPGYGSEADQSGVGLYLYVQRRKQGKPVHCDACGADGVEEADCGNVFRDDADAVPDGARTYIVASKEYV